MACDLPVLLFGHWPARRAMSRQYALEHALYIAIHYGYGFTKSNAGDGSSRIAANAGQFTQRLCRPRKPAFSCDFFGCCLKVARTAVISQSAPRREHRCLI